MFNKKSDEGYRQVLDGVMLKTLVHGGKTMLCEFRIAKGKKIPSHAHLHEQTGYLVSGRVKFQVDDQTFEARPGDSWCVSGDQPHAAESLEDSVIIEVFSPVREDYLARTDR